MSKKFPVWLFIAAIVVVPVTVFAVVKWYQHTYAPLPVLIDPQHRIADFELRNQNGGNASLHDWENKIVVANFFFTHCPVVCPKMMRNLKETQRYYINDPEIMLASFTVDPEHDSVEQLQRYAKKMDIQGSWLLLTGAKADLYKLARKSFLITATDGDGGPEDFIHSDQLVLIDKQKRIRGYYSGTDEKNVANLVRDIARLKEEQ